MIPIDDAMMNFAARFHNLKKIPPSRLVEKKQSRKAELEAARE
jgi:hypothetical protein